MVSIYLIIHYFYKVKSPELMRKVAKEFLTKFAFCTHISNIITSEESRALDEKTKIFFLCFADPGIFTFSSQTAT
jgi:hypothetical protein